MLKPADPFKRQMWRLVDGAVRDAFHAHPEYLAVPEMKVRQAIVKRVTGAITGYAGATRAKGRSGITAPAAEASDRQLGSSDERCRTTPAPRGRAQSPGPTPHRRADDHA